MQNNIKKAIIAAEREYEQILQEQAEVIFADKEIKLVLITGGSCAGKTTTAEKLTKKLNEMGRKTHIISLDDFFRNITDAVFLEDGTQDIESINSLEVGLIKECFSKLVGGKQAAIPKFSFITKMREENHKQIVLQEDDIAIVEGLHALNPILLEGLSINSNVFKIYLYTDDGAKGDPRFLRRLVRDYNYRGANAELTYSQWDYVLAHEPEYIDQFSDKVNIKINTYFDYETGLFAQSAIDILNRLPEDNRHTPHAKRTISRLSKVPPVLPSHIPTDSLMREFIKE